VKACESGPLEVRGPGIETARLNLGFPLYGRGRVDFTRTAKQAIQSIPRKAAA
jgi:GH18 family chitinase